MGWAGDRVSDQSTPSLIPPPAYMYIPRHKSSTSRFGGGNGFLLPRAKSHYAPDLRLVPSHLGK